MTIGPDDRATRSAAGWSEGAGGEPVTGDANPLALDPDVRYVDIELAGVGGMGTVMVARDQRLDREVAIKRIAVDVEAPDASARLAREASITARLEHPSIVPVYDAGVGADGRAYYAMRLIRGRSLAAVLSDAAPEFAIHLLRPFLAVCQAMAYAHRHGVLHRDLKPANIMIGEFGEVHVVDWGLAQVIDEPDGVTEDTAGTPAYLAPERVRGEPATRASDVWALGAILVEIVAGRRWLPSGRIEILALMAADRTPPRHWPARVPSELIAIADKALAWEPRDRYPDAAVLADDVSAFLDGRRVGAHAYTTTELARRLVHAWRWQLAALTAAMVAGGAVLGLSWSRIAGERRRAVVAERRATGALVETRDALAWALDRSAVAALLAGDVAEAEGFAAQALDYGESIDARGVLAATRAGARPLAVEHVDVPACGKLAPDDLEHVVCYDGATVSWWRLGDATPSWARALPASSVASVRGGPMVALENGVAVSLLARDDGRTLARFVVPPVTNRILTSRDHARVAVMSQRETIVIDVARAQISPTLRPCDTQVVDAVALGTEAIYAVCRDGRVLAFDDVAAPGRELARVPFGISELSASAAAVDENERRLWIGNIAGQVLSVELKTGQVSASRQALTEPVRALGALGHLIALSGERGGVRLWGRGLDAELLRLPERAGHAFAIVGDDLVTGGVGWWRWRTPQTPSPRRYAVGGVGLSSAAVSPDGSQVVAARGDGRISIWRTRLGALRAEPVVGTGVVKRVDFAPDGRELTTVIAGNPEETVVDLTMEAPVVSRSFGGSGAHRVAYTLSGERLVLPYRASMTVTDVTGARVEQTTAPFDDLEPTSDRTLVWLCGLSGDVWRYRDGDLTAQFTMPGVFAVAPLSDGRVAVATPSQIVITDGRGVVDRRLEVTNDLVLDIAVSPDDRWLAAGTGAGTVEVWSIADGRRVAHLRGHAARVPWVGFAAGALWSASWDGAVLRWDLRALAAGADELIRDASTSWGLPQLHRASVP